MIPHWKHHKLTRQQLPAIPHHKPLALWITCPALDTMDLGVPFSQDPSLSHHTVGKVLIL